MSSWLARLRALDSELHSGANGADGANRGEPPAPIGTSGTIGTWVESRIESVTGKTFPCPRCRRALPISRSRDKDFTMCVCCKLDLIEARHRRRQGVPG
jgi:hypothetical protein